MQVDNVVWLDVFTESLNIFISSVRVCVCVCVGVCVCVRDVCLGVGDNYNPYRMIKMRNQNYIFIKIKKQSNTQQLTNKTHSNGFSKLSLLGKENLCDYLV